jgi:DNA topoisomerase-1
MAVALMQFDAFDTAAQAKRNIRGAIKAVAPLLGNTPTICRKCYVHPALLDAYLEGELGRLMASKPRKRAAQEENSGLKPEEAAVLALLRARIKETIPIKSSSPRQSARSRSRRTSYAKGSKAGQNSPSLVNRKRTSCFNRCQGLSDWR